VVEPRLCFPFGGQRAVPAFGEGDKRGVDAGGVWIVGVEVRPAPLDEFVVATAVCPTPTHRRCRMYSRRIVREGPNSVLARAVARVESCFL
jgi:hypothetical protein